MDYHAQLTFLLFTTQQTLLLFWCYHNQQPLLSFRDYHTRQPILLFILRRNSGVVIHCKHSLHSRVNKLRGLLDYSWAIKLIRYPCYQYHTTYRGYVTQNTAQLPMVSVNAFPYTTENTLCRHPSTVRVPHTLAWLPYLFTQKNIFSIIGVFLFLRYQECPPSTVHVLYILSIC